MRYYMLLFGFIVTAAAQGQRLGPSSLEIPCVGYGLYALEEYDGKLFIGGQFPSVNGVAMRSIAAWDGSSMQAMPGAFDGPGVEHVKAMKLFQGTLVVGGRSTALGHVARWDGSQWSPYGMGLSDQVNALEVHAGELIAGCQNGSVMRWDGSFWEHMGVQLNGAVLSMAVHQGILYAGGEFTASADGQAMKHIAHWTGSEWSALGTGFDAKVNCLKSDALGLLIGGNFTFTGDSSMALPGCARYQYSMVSPIPGVTDGQGISSFFRQPNGELLIAGATVDGRSLRSARPRALAAFQGSVYAAGMFLNLPSWRSPGALAKLLPGNEYVSLNANRIDAAVSAHPSCFQQWWNGRSGFEVPKGAGTNTIYTSSPWIEGYVNGQHQQAVPWYAQDEVPGEHRRAGPLASTMDDAYYERYHRVWKLDRALVQYHIANWGMTGYVVPEVILSWPGNGIVTNGEPLRLAPFEDLNGNDLYEPQLGEYPLIKGTHAVYSIQHTAPNYSLVPNGIEPMPFDLHVMHYVFEGVNDALDFTVFVNHSFVNRSSDTYEDVRFAQFTDFDLGCTSDDLGGCDSTRSLMFTYNGSEFDVTCPGVPGFGEQPPAQGMRYLNHAMRSHRIRRQGSGPEPSTHDMFHGLNLGQPFMNLGYPTRFECPGGAWLDEYPYGAARSQSAATGPFTLGPGDTLCIDLAFVYARASSGGAYASVEALKLRSDSVQAFYNAQGIACNQYPIMTSVREYATPMALHVFPNPASQQLTVAGAAALSEVLVLDMQGRVVHRERTGQVRITLDAQAWAPGTYMLRSGNAAVRLVKE